MIDMIDTDMIRLCKYLYWLFDLYNLWVICCIHKL